MNYIYCVINKGTRLNLGNIGVEDREVYTIPYNDISLVVHDSDKAPELNEDDHVISHQYVISLFTKRFNTVIPFGMNTFINEEKVTPFLEKNYETFKKRLELLKDKSEFVIKIFYEPKPKTTELKESVKGYIDGQKRLRKEVIEEVARLREEFYNQIKDVADDTRLQDGEEDKVSLLSVSCLMHKDRVEKLEELSKKIRSLEGFRVRLNGPLTVCSFA